MQQATVDKLKPETVNTSWNNLWSWAVNDFKGFLEIDGEVKEIIRTAREDGGERFVDMVEEELEERVEEYQELLTNEEVEDLVKSSTEGEEEI